MQWAGNHATKGCVFKQNCTTQGAVLNQLFAEYNEKGVIPCLLPASLEDGSIVEIFAFGFEQMILSLLSDVELMEDHNVEAVDVQISSYLYTSGFASAYEHLHVDQKDVIFPIQMFFDKTRLNDLGKLPLEPVHIYTIQPRDQKLAMHLASIGLHQ